MRVPAWHTRHRKASPAGRFSGSPSGVTFANPISCRRRSAVPPACPAASSARRGEHEMATAPTTGVSDRAISPSIDPMRPRPGMSRPWIAGSPPRCSAPSPTALSGSSSGTAAAPTARQTAPRGTLVGDRRALLGLAVNPNLYFGEAYMAGRSASAARSTRSSTRCRAAAPRIRRAGNAPRRSSRAPTTSRRRAATSTITTISATTSTRSGSTPRWSTPARITTDPRP